MTSQINIFISYCHKNEEDEKFLDDLLMFIKPPIDNLENGKLWVDRKILTGQDLRPTIEAALNEMNLMICLISPEYLNSEYCINKELEDALEKRKIGAANIFPIILRKCSWKYTFFNEVLCQPKDGIPLKDWDDKEQILSDITDELMRVIYSLKNHTALEKKKLTPKTTNLIDGGAVESTKLANYLDNLGIQIKHASKDFILLNEIFVYPDMRIMNDISTIRRNTWTPQEVLKEHNFVYFLGTEEIGKTSLLKKLAQDYQANNKKVIILNGADIKSTNIESIIQSFKDRFEINDFPSYDQVSIFIDDFEKQKLKPQHLDSLLKKFKEQFQQVVIFVDKKQFIQSQSKYMKHEFIEAEILPFGYKKRHELIKKWVLLDSDDDENIISDEVYNRIDLFSRNFDSIMKKNIMDSRPIYIISIMQTLENLSYTNGNYSLTSYGQCYHVLITGMLSKAKVAINDLDGVLNFLSFLAYYFYKLKIDQISEEEFDNVISDYSKRFVPPYEVKEILLNSGILASPDNDSLRFSQKYLYYFACAKHISDNSTILQSDITYLCQNIHNEHNANILIFLVHHLRGTGLLDEIQTHAICLLDHINTFDMSLDAIHDYKRLLGDRLMKLTLDETKTVEEQRTERLQRQDDLEAEFGDLSPVNYALEDNNINGKVLEDSKDFDLIQQATSALRSIDVLGQIAKNRHSSIPIDDLKSILTSTYNVGLKVLNFYLSVFNDNEKDLEHLLLDIIRDNNKELSETESKEFAKNLVHNFIYAICLYMIQLVSQSTAHTKLINISNDISEDTEATAAFKLINLHSQLLISSKLPKNLIKKIKREHTNNILVMSLMSSIVANHAYLHNLDYQDKQWIHSQLGIEVAQQLKSNAQTLQPLLS